MIVVEDSKPIREVLAASYAALGLEWDTATAGGAANDLLPHLDVATVDDAVIELTAVTQTSSTATSRLCWPSRRRSVERVGARV